MSFLTELINSLELGYFPTSD